MTKKWFTRKANKQNIPEWYTKLARWAYYDGTVVTLAFMLVMIVMIGASILIDLFTTPHWVIKIIGSSMMIGALGMWMLLSAIVGLVECVKRHNDGAGGYEWVFRRRRRWFDDK